VDDDEYKAVMAVMTSPPRVVIVLDVLPFVLPINVTTSLPRHHLSCFRLAERHGVVGLGRAQPGVVALGQGWMAWSPVFEHPYKPLIDGRRDFATLRCDCTDCVAFRAFD
jgi:hypothetical protein